MSSESYILSESLPEKEINNRNAPKRGDNFIVVAAEVLFLNRYAKG
jgi:hypothetical protein